MDVRFHVYPGPNLHTPFAAVAAEFASPPAASVAAAAVEALWQRIGGVALWGRDRPSQDVSFASVVAAVAARLERPGDATGAEVSIQSAEDGKTRVFVGCLDSEATTQNLMAALQFAMTLFSGAPNRSDPGGMSPGLEPVREALRVRQAQASHSRTLMLAEARRRGIPVYPVAENSRFWQFGQGAAGIHYSSTASDRDSLTGGQLAANKVWSNRLITRLGFPGVVHAVAANPQMAGEIARRIGYPVVLKPIASLRGYGVSTDLRDQDEIDAAFARAARFSPQGVIVERFVNGIDHRLAVFGGRLAWMIMRFPAAVTGDGQQTIAQLIDAENRRRRASVTNDRFLEQIKPDESMTRQLRKQGYALDDRPAAGTTVALRGVASISQGGTLLECTERLHPDNRDLAESLARAFRMTNLGVDLITPDISRSWREVPCAVIEVNEMPGVTFDTQAQRMLETAFRSGTSGRIPSVLVIGPAPGLLERVTQALGAAGRRVGETDLQSTRLGEMARCRPDERLAGRVRALIADPGCEALAVETTVAEIQESGLPLDRFDLAMSPAPLPQAVRELTAACCDELIVGAGPEAIWSQAQPLIERLAPLRP